MSGNLKDSVPLPVQDAEDASRLALLKSVRMNL